MKKRFSLTFLMIFLLLSSLLLSACSSALDPGGEQTKETQDEARTTQEETKEEFQKNIMQQYDPSEDDEMNILMIGNSYCYYYVDELYGLAKEAGIELTLYNVYYSGCTLGEHWEWLQQNLSKYEFFKTDRDGRRRVSKTYSLKDCLKAENWDVITLQHASRAYRFDGAEGLLASYEPYLTNLLGYIQEQFPKSKYYWHASWVPEVGYTNSPNFSINTREEEEAFYQAKKICHQDVFQNHHLPLIPTGEAWHNARYNPVINDTLCLRLAKLDDHGHDGDVGGGQYLNACVWFEALTGKSCIGNTFRPSYELSEEKIAVLQEAAHKAVESFKAEGYLF